MESREHWRGRISDSRDYLERLMKDVERQATRIAYSHGADVSDSFIEYF